jgi:hypothetical protein
VSDPILRLLSDRPIEGDAVDLLDRWREADRLARLLRESRLAAPFTLAVYADWGMGKSSLLNQTAELLEREPDFAVVRFNAWLADSGNGLEMLIKSVLDKVDRRSLRKLVREISGDSMAVSWMRVVATGAAGIFRLHYLVDGIWERLNVDARTRNRAQQLLREAIARYAAGEERGGMAKGRTITVFVDDLDRCPPETIRVVCSAIKQYLNVPGIAFVIGCDRAIVESALGEDEGHRYLEKIIQASWPIAAPTDAQVEQLISGYAADAGVGELIRGPVVRAIADHAQRNPRRIKRLINRFVIEYRLDPEWAEFGALSLISTMLLQDGYPAFYRLVTLSGEFDPIEVFDGYLALIEGFDRRSDDEDEYADRTKPPYDLQAYDLVNKRGLKMPANMTSQFIETVERDLPEDFPRLVRDKTFVVLMRTLVSARSAAALRAKLRRQRYERERVSLLRHAASGDSAVRRLQVLWLSSREESANQLQRLAQNGAVVTEVSDIEEARMRLDESSYDVIIGNLSRPGAPEGGFADLSRIRRDGYNGTILIFTAYVSPARRERAREVDALITDNSAQLERWLFRGHGASVNIELGSDGDD